MQTSRRAMSAVLLSKVNPAAADVYFTLGRKLTPAATAFYRELGLCHGKHIDEYTVQVHERHIQQIGASGRRGLGQLYPYREIQMQGLYLDVLAEDEIQT